MSSDQGRKWTDREPGVAWIQKDEDSQTGYKIYVVSQVEVNFKGPWADEAVQLGAEAAADPILSEAGLYDPTGQFKNADYIKLEAGPIVSARPKDPPILLFSIEANYDDTGNNVIISIPEADYLEDVSSSPDFFTYDPAVYDSVRFSSFTEFSKRLEILALRCEEEYAVKVQKEGIMYWGPEESYGAFDFLQEAGSLRHFYREILDFLKKNNISYESFRIVFITDKWDEKYDKDTSTDYMNKWIEGVRDNGIAILDGFDDALKYGNEFINTSPIINDPRRLWMIRRIVEATGKMAPFAEYSTDISVDPTDPSNISFGCQSPAFSKEVPQFTHGEYVKRFVRPSPKLQVVGPATEGAGGWWKQAAASLIQWEAFSGDYYAAKDEISSQWEKDFADNILREMAQNRRRSTAEYIGDYFMKRLPGAPKKIRSLHDVWTHLLSRMDFPTLIQEGLECMWAGFGLSLEDVLDMLCDEMLDQFFSDTTLDKMHEFAKFLDSGKPIPGVTGEALSYANINVTDVAYVIRDFLEEEAADLTESELSKTKLSPETQQALAIAIEQRIGSNNWKRFLCDAIIAAAYLFGKGILALIDAIRKAKEEEIGAKGKEAGKKNEQIPPFKKCDNTIDTLMDLPIIGTLYEMAVKEAKKQIDKKVLEFIEEELVEPCRTWLWSWQKYCIDNDEDDVSKMGAFSMDDFPKTANDSKKLQDFFGEDFDFERFLNSLFAGLTDSELCGLLRGETPSDKVSRYVVQFVKNYTDIPTKIVSRVSEKSKVVSFFNSISAYIDKSVCNNLSQHPQNLISGPCDELDFNYAEQMMRAALKNRGLSDKDVNDQIDKQKELIKGDLKDSISALAKTSGDFQQKLQEDIQEAAKEGLKGVMTDEDSGSFALSLDAILNIIKASFKGSAANFYSILVSDPSLYEQTYHKLFLLMSGFDPDGAVYRPIFGEDNNAYDTNESHTVSKYHNYNFSIDVDDVPEWYIDSEIEDEASEQSITFDPCHQIMLHKQLMVDIMHEAGWDCWVKPGNVSIPQLVNAISNVPGQGSRWQGPPTHAWAQNIGVGIQQPERERLIYDGPTDGEYKTFRGTFPDPFLWAGMSNFAYNRAVLAGEAYIAGTQYGNIAEDANLPAQIMHTTLSVSNYFQGNNLIGNIYSNVYDPANLLNSENVHFVGNLSAEKLDDLFRIAFRYYTRYSFNYQFNPLDKSNYYDNTYGKPKSECSILMRKSPDDDSTESYWGYSSFLEDPNDYDDLQVAEFLEHVDFRCGHRGPGVTPFKEHHDQDAEAMPWSTLLNWLAVQHPQGVPYSYEKAVEENFGGYGTPWPWGAYGNFNGTGWNTSNSKECLLRIFLFRFILQGLDQSKTQLMHPAPGYEGVDDDYETYAWTQAVPMGMVTKSVLQISLAPDRDPSSKGGAGGTYYYVFKWGFPKASDEWDPNDLDDDNDYNNLIGGHMERALAYYEQGLDFHPGYSIYPYGQENFQFSENPAVYEPTPAGFAPVYIWDVTQINKPNYGALAHTFPFDDFKYSELAEEMFHFDEDGSVLHMYAGTPGDNLLLALNFDKENAHEHPVSKEIIDVQPVADSSGQVPTLYVVPEDGPNEGQKLPAHAHRPRPTPLGIIYCAFKMGMQDYAPEYEAKIKFSLLSQQTKDYLPLSNPNSTGCIIDRYAIETKVSQPHLFIGSTFDHEEEQKLIGIVGPLKDAKKDPTGKKIIDSSDRGRFEKIKEVLADPDILERTFVPGEFLGGDYEPKLALQPQVFEQYFTKKMKDNSIGLLPYVNPHVGEEEYESTTLQNVLLKKLGTYGSFAEEMGRKQLYGVMFRHVIRKIAKLMYDEKSFLQDSLDKVDYSKLEMDLDSIKQSALQFYQDLVNKSDPTQDPPPGLDEVFLSMTPEIVPIKDEKGNVIGKEEHFGAVAAKILIKIIVLEYFMKSISPTTVFSIEETMKDSVIHDAIASEASEVIDQFYKDKLPKYAPSYQEIKRLTRSVIDVELADIVSSFSQFFNKQYESVVDQVILKNDKVYDLARTKKGLFTWAALKEGTTPGVNVLGTESFLGPNSPNPGIYSMWVEPRFTHVEKLGEIYGPNPMPGSPQDIPVVHELDIDIGNDYEGFFLEKYIKIQFHSQEKIKSNLKKSENPEISDVDADEIAEKIMELPVEHKGGMRYGVQNEDIEGRPVYLNLDEFKEVFSKIFNGAPQPTSCGSLFEWKQLAEPLGFKEEFDSTIKEMKDNWDQDLFETLPDGSDTEVLDPETGKHVKKYPYESSVAGHIQEELALLEQICTLVPQETQIDKFYKNFVYSVTDEGVPWWPWDNETADYSGNTCKAGYLWEFDVGLAQPGATWPEYIKDDDFISGAKIPIHGQPLPYSDLSYKSWHLYPVDENSAAEQACPGGLTGSPYRHLNQVSTDNCNYVPYDEISQTRPYSIEYLEHLNGGKVYNDAKVQNLIEKTRNWDGNCNDLWKAGGYSKGDLVSKLDTEESSWSSVALAPLMSDTWVNEVIPDENHRKMLARIGFRYYTVKYFGDYAGFTFDPLQGYLTAPGEGADNWSNLDQIFRGESVTIPAEYRYDGVDQDYASGMFFGESKGIAEQIFPDDPERRGLASKPGKGLFFGIDPHAKVGVYTEDKFAGGGGGIDGYSAPAEGEDGGYCYIAPFYWGAYIPADEYDGSDSDLEAGPNESMLLEEAFYPPGFSNYEEFERYMIFGLFFGFDSVAKWKILREQAKPYNLSTGDGPLDFHGGNAVENLPPNTPGWGDFEHWTSSYQRDLYNALRLYKYGLDEIDGPGPVELFTNGKIVSDYMPAFYSESLTPADTFKLSNYAKEASYGLRLSCALPGYNGTSVETKQNPLEIFWKYIIPYFEHAPAFANIPDNDPPESLFEDLVTIKRIKSYYLKELHKFEEPETTAMHHSDEYSKEIFIVPLLEENTDILDKDFSSLVSQPFSWFEGGDMIGNDGTKKNYQILYKNMKDRDEFKLLFEYVFPVKRILSLLAVYQTKSLEQSQKAAALSEAFKITKELISKLSVPSGQEVT